MRELKRSIARYLMQLQGIERINKKQYRVADGNGADTGKRTSYFALHWKEYLDPSNKLHKRAVQRLKTARGRRIPRGFYS